MQIERGTAYADVPHKFQPDADDGPQLAAPTTCRTCGEAPAAVVHSRWSEVNTASRESAAAQLPRVHG